MTDVIHLDASESAETRNGLATEINLCCSNVVQCQLCSDVAGDKRPWVIPRLLIRVISQLSLERKSLY